DGQDVVPTLFDDLRTDIAVGEHRVAGDDLALDRHDTQQFQRGLVFVGLGVDPQLGHDGSDVRGIRRDQVNARRVAVTTAPGRLAVEGDVRGVLRAKLPLNPTPDPRLEVGDVDAAKDPRIGGLAQAPPGGEPEVLEELPAPQLAVVNDRLVTG